MKTNIKRLAIISTVTVAGFFFIIIFRSFLITKYNDYMWYKKTDNFISALQAPFKEDTYGGKTPEETWAMYVDAVKMRDIDLASKYYDVNHQSQQKKYLEDGLSSGKWDLYVNDISTNALTRRTDIADFLRADKQRAYYFYQYENSDKNKKTIVDVNFYLNPLTNVWKILY